MKNINLNLGSGIDYAKAEKAAREEAAKMAWKFSLLAWYDVSKKILLQNPLFLPCLFSNVKKLQ